MFRKLVELPRNSKRALMLLSDSASIPLAYWLAINLRLDFSHAFPKSDEWAVIFCTSLLTILFFIRSGLYRAVVRYMGMEAAWAVTRGAIVSALILTSVSFLFGAELPRSVPFIYFLVILAFVGGSRFFVRHLIYMASRQVRRRVAIYGAGEAGTQVLMALSSSPEYKPVLCVDDKSALQGRILHGVPVVSREQLASQIEAMKIDDLLLAIPSASRARRKQVVDSVSHLPVHVRTIPGMVDLVSGKARIEEFRELDIEDLLGRDPVTPDDTLLHANIRGKVVMVTGAGGSIGSELCRQIARLQPECLVLFEQSEFALYQIERELDALVRSLGLKVRILAMLGSVVDKKLLESCVRNLKVQTIYHAAAYKHVPLVEYNVVAGIRNNVFGTLHVAEVADRCGVETCVLISTDKAVRPTNVMGASKRLSELVLQGMQKRQSKTRFSMVRFGNVLGSSGSVIPLFREQIASGGPVTVTHPEIIRYFMTIPEAAQLVIQAGAMAKGGDVFVLDMGEPVRIDDLARKMILLMGYQVKDAAGEGDIEIVYTGLRPGEKLYEELLIGDNVTATAHPRVMRATEFALEWPALNNILRDLERLCAQEDCASVREFLQDIPIEFNPQGELEDLVWRHREADGVQEEPAPLAEVVSFKKRKELVS
ncbi:MAG: polysaccharide biosynthesis protein [Pseudomonadota bacterium]